MSWSMVYDVVYFGCVAGTVASWLLVNKIASFARARSREVLYLRKRLEGPELDRSLLAQAAEARGHCATALRLEAIEAAKRGSIDRMNELLEAADEVLVTHLERGA